MGELKRLTLYRERNYSDQNGTFPSIKDNMNVLSEQLSKDIAEYMHSGKVLIEFVSPTPDPYNPSDMVRSVILSDGVYVWDGIILHWVEKYRVRLPNEFLEHIIPAASKNDSMGISFLEAL